MLTILLLVPQPAHAEQVNGEYTIGFNILHSDKKNASIAEGYWNQPAKVLIKDGSIRIQATINKHAWVTKFAISYNGSMSEVKTISVDEAANTRITEFQISNFTDLVESNVSVNIGEIDYEHSYTMYFKFKPDTLTLVKAEKPPVPDAPQAPAASAPAQEAPASPAPSASPPAAAPPQEVKPAAPVVEQKEKPTATPTLTPTPAPAEGAGQSDQDSPSQKNQSDDDAVLGAEEAAEPAEEAGSDGESGNEQSDAAQQGKDASEISAMEETPVADAVPAEETLEGEEGATGSTMIIVIAIIIVLIAAIAGIVYRTRHNKK